MKLSTAGTAILVSVVSMFAGVTAEAEPWTIRFIERSSARLFGPVITADGVRIESLGADTARRKGRPEYVSLHYRLDGAISALSFDYAQTGEASLMPIQLLDVAGRKLWHYDGHGDAPERVELNGLKTRGLLVFRVSRSRGAKLPEGWSHSISDLSFTKDTSEPVVDTDGYIVVGTLDELRGICTGLSAAPDQVINCEVNNCIAAGYNVGSGDTIVGCRADAKYAEALCVPYLRSEGARVDLEILDGRERMANNLVAKINGRNHDISLSTSEPVFVPKEMAIELASKNGYGSFQRGERRASGVTLNNQTSARVVLLPGAVGNTIISQSPVIDQGEADNTIRRGE